MKPPNPEEESQDEAEKLCMELCFKTSLELHRAQLCSSTKPPASPMTLFSQLIRGSQHNTLPHTTSALTQQEQQSPVRPLASPHTFLGGLLPHACLVLKLFSKENLTGALTQGMQEPNSLRKLPLLHDSGC